MKKTDSPESEREEILFQKVLGYRIRKLRKEQKLTSRYVSLYVGYEGKSSLSMIENGNAYHIPLYRLRLIAKALNTSVSKLTKKPTVWEINAVKAREVVKDKPVSNPTPVNFIDLTSSNESGNDYQLMKLALNSYFVTTTRALEHLDYAFHIGQIPVDKYWADRERLIVRKSDIQNLIDKQFNND
jgi:transcriptional regulator with XRE-family HTH domain